ncbi:MAG: acyl-CoA desaturase [Chitinophagales bacterium]|nr:acyl-CoA desaturase [Chitinophagales bacterium]
MSKVSFNNKPNPFFLSLKKKVDAIFENKKIHPSGNRALFFKNILFIGTLIGLYILLVFFTPPAIISVFLCAILGIDFALIGFNIMHEAGHQSISRYKWLNTVSAYSLNLMGGNSHFWKLKHNISHHTYTNISGEDHDINLSPFMRVDENQPRYWFHKYQHFYWIFFYSLTYLAWVLIADFQKYFTGRMAPGAEQHTFSLREHLIFWITKFFYFGIYMVLPVFMVGLVPTLVGYLIAAGVCGLFISIIFQMAHIVEATSFPKPDTNSKRIEHEWAIHQVRTTADFATNSKVISWLVGGLNFQVEHHLFPKVSHIHYSKIRKLVEETCKEHKVQYNEYSSLFKAFKSHLSYLKRLGSA